MQATELKPNSFVFLAVPDASRSQWHPFTLSIVRNSTDAKQPAQATIFVKPYGSWAQVMAISAWCGCVVFVRCVGTTYCAQLGAVQIIDDM